MAYKSIVGVEDDETSLPIETGRQYHPINLCYTKPEKATKVNKYNGERYE